MPIPPIIAGSLLGGAFGLFGQGMASQQSNKIQSQNLSAQKDLLKWQKSAQQTTWNREDNAVQRRVNDLKLAGISPQAAAGGAAQSSGPIGMKAPQRDPSIPVKNQAGMQNVINSVANIAQTLAQTQVLQATKGIRDVERDVAVHTKNSVISRSESEASKAKTDAALAAGTLQSQIKSAEAIYEKLNLDNKYSQRTFQNRVKEQALKINMIKKERDKLVETLESRIRATSASAQLSRQQAVRVASLLPKELTNIDRKNYIQLLQTEDYEALPPRARTAIMLMISGLKNMF